ncbi:hypothetical protein QU24_26195 [Pantoea rodasii]|uniref:Uncharacterized protein n=1 Tax=Pantoea rodasii TaxID=1076549 RepID=A0A0B1QWK4_9GAMM|nr:hypothetical protein QU24_26195 [Pantoea rodasii]
MARLIANGMTRLSGEFYSLKGRSQSLADNILKRFIQTSLEDGDLFCLLSDPLQRRVQDRF